MAEDCPPAMVAAAKDGSTVPLGPILMAVDLNGLAESRRGSSPRSSTPLGTSPGGAGWPDRLANGGGPGGRSGSQICALCPQSGLAVSPTSAGWPDRRRYPGALAGSCCLANSGATYELQPSPLA